MKEVSLLEMIGRSFAKVAAGAGVAALLIWLTYVMLDIGNMQSGFTVKQNLDQAIRCVDVFMNDVCNR